MATDDRAASESLIISKSRTREAVGDLNVSSEFYEALDLAVRQLLREAARRARANDRKTLRPCDL